MSETRIGPRNEPDDEATRIFLEFVESGRALGRDAVDALVAAHPEHAAAIAGKWDDWERVHAAFSADRPESGAPAWQRFLAQLRSRGEPWRRYRDGGEIARGGMGVIRRVFDEDTRRELAMKVTLTSRAPVEEDDASVGRFLEEAQVTAQLDHPGIVPVHEVGVDGDGRVYFTMKLVKGEDLRAVFDKVRTGEEGWSRTRVVSVMLRVCEALAYAHEKGVVHRDLKPGNVMVGRFGEAYVMDWGLARVLDAPPVASEPRPRAASIVRTERREEAAATPRSPLLTLEGDVVGTPAYMPPEQAEGRLDRLGPPADVYAVGAMLYHLLSGRMPYASPTRAYSPQVILGMVLHGPPAPLAEVAPDAPAELVSICDRAMARDRADRYATMTALADDLRAYLEGRVVRAHATGPWPELRKWVARNRALAASMGVAALIVAGSVLLYAWQERTRAREVGAQRDVAWAVSQFQSEVLAIDPWRDGRDISALDLIDRAAARVGEYIDDPAIEGWLRHSLGVSYQSYGRMEDAERELRAAAELLARAYGPRHEYANDARGRLAWLVQLRGDHGAALPIQEEVLEWCRANRGADHAETLSAMSNLAATLDMLDRDDEAIALARRVLDVRRTTLDPDDPALALSRGNLAAVLANAGRYGDAEPLQREVLAYRRAHSTSDEPELWRAMMNLARTLSSLGRGAEAEPMMVEVVERHIDVLGRAHPRTLVSMASLAEFLEEWGLVEEAALLLEDVATRAATAREVHHEAAFDAWNRLALIRETQGRLDESLAILSNLVEVQRERFGDAHPRFGWSLRALGAMLFRAGRLAEAEAAHGCALELDLKYRGAFHPHTWSSRMNLAGVVCRRGRHDEALRAYRDVVAARVARLGADDVEVLEARMNVANELAHVGRVEEAVEESGAVAGAFERSIGLGRARTLRAVLNHAVNLEMIGRFEEAEAVHRRSAAGHRSLFGEDDPRTWTALVNLAYAKLHLERNAEAAELLVEAESRRTARFGPDSIPALEASAGVAFADHRLGRDEESERRAARVLEKILPFARTGHRVAAGLCAGFLFDRARERTDEATMRRLVDAWPSLANHP